MIFSDLEISAIMCGLRKLALVDEKLSIEEKQLYMQICNNLEATEYNTKLSSKLELNPAITIEVVRSFSQEKKELYSALLYKMMNADGIEDFSEESFIQGTYLFYNLPKITPEKANELFNNFITGSLVDE